MGKIYVGGQPGCRKCGMTLDFPNDKEFITLTVKCPECGEIHDLRQHQEKINDEITEVWFTNE